MSPEREFRDWNKYLGDRHEMVERGSRPSLNAFESLVFDAYEELAEPEEGIVPGNKDIRNFLSDAFGFETTRAEVGRARKKIAKKLGKKAGW